MVKKKMTVVNPTGFHVRPASVLVKAAESCSSRVEILYGNSIINAKSLLNVLSGVIRCGAEIEVCCDGENEQQDLEKITETILQLK